MISPSTDRNVRTRHGARRIAVVAGLLLAGAIAGIAAWRTASRRGAPEASGAPFETAAGGPIDVVLITIDTLRADRLSCYGSRTVDTPHLDTLAREGVLFANAATTVPFTLPAHSSLMTGTYPPKHGVRENVGYVLGDGLPTMAERLAAGGWQTAGFVSAFVLDSRWGIARGFDTYFDDFELGGGRRANLGAVQRDGRETLAETIRWLDAAPRRPFFLWLHLFDPHDPYTPPEPFKSRYPGRPYDAEVAYVDSLVGDFRRALEQRGLFDPSLVVVTGDHGEGLGEHREGFHGFFLYDSTVHVPLIVRLPGGAHAGRRVGSAVSHVDLLPTVLEATGQPTPDGLHGRSLLPLIVGGESARVDERSVYSESLYPLLHYGWAPLRSVRTRRHKLIEAPRPELYDLAADPGERDDLLHEDRRTARELRDRLASLRDEIERESSDPARRAELDDETLDRLQALGYVAGRGAVALEEEAGGERADPKDRVELHQLVMAAQSDMGAGDLERAAERLRRALAGDPGIVEAHQMLGAIALDGGRLDESIEQFQAALAGDPELEPAILGLADAYRRQGRIEEALVGYERLLELDPRHLQATLAVADLRLEQGSPDQAIARLEAAAALDEPAAIVLVRLGELLVEAGRVDEAEERFRQALERNPELAQPAFNLAVLREEAGDVDEAIALYERAIERAPGHFQAQFNLGRLVGGRGDADRQERLYEAALESNPEFVRGHFFLAKLLMDRGGDLARAERLTRRGLELDPEGATGPLGYYLLADLLNRTGRQAEAARSAERGRQLEAAVARGG